MNQWQRLAKHRVRELKVRFGYGWHELGDSIREALVAREIVSVLLAQVENSAPLASMQDMAQAFYKELEQRR